MIVLLHRPKNATIRIQFPPPPKPHRRFHPQNVYLRSSPPSQNLNPILRSSSPPTISSSSSSSSSVRLLKPYLVAQRAPILKGWLCSAVSVLCLSAAVPNIGRIPTLLSGGAVEAGTPLLVLSLVNCSASYLQQAFLWEAALRIVSELRADVFDRVLRWDLECWEGGGGVLPGDVAFRITAEAADVADTLHALLNMLVPSTLQLVAMASRMVSIFPMLSLMTAMAIPCLCLVVTYLGDCLRRISQKAHASAARLSSYLNEVLPSVLIVKTNNAEPKESSLFRKLIDDDLQCHLKKKKMKAFVPQIIQVLGIAGLIGLCASSVLISQGCFDGSKIISFVTSMVLLVEPIKGIGKAYNEFKQGEPAVERLFNLTKFKSKVADKLDAYELEAVQGDIKFFNVAFRYEDNMPLVLNGLNLHVKQGETIALVGPSGGGKTTLVKLLLRLYHPICGCILLDDHDILDIQLKSLRRHVSLVSQDIVLFSGSVAENIAYRDFPGKINMQDVKNAARISNADEFIRKLPDGYETDVGPKGSRLSGGQKQRLAIARALYRKSSILILDEATSALDSVSETLVREALRRLMLDHTVIIIAHRLETVVMADRIFLLEGGRLEEMTRSTFLSSHGNFGSFLANGSSA